MFEDDLLSAQSSILQERIKEIVESYIIDVQASVREGALDLLARLVRVQPPSMIPQFLKEIIERLRAHAHAQPSIHAKGCFYSCQEEGSQTAAGGTGCWDAGTFIKHQPSALGSHP
jgi:hypothetical protein